MKDRYDRILWTVIAVFLGIIALNPWFAPGVSNAQPGVMKVDIARIDGDTLAGHIGLPVYIKNSVTLDVRKR